MNDPTSAAMLHRAREHHYANTARQILAASVIEQKFPELRCLEALSIATTVAFVLRGDCADCGMHLQSGSVLCDRCIENAVF